MEYYRIRSMDMLNREFLNLGDSGIMRLQADLEREFQQKLNESEQYNDIFSNYHHISTWMNQQVNTKTTNVIYTFECVYKKPKGGNYTHEQNELLQKLGEVQKAASKYSSSRNKAMPWNERALKAAMETHMQHGVVFIPEKTKIVPLSGYDAQGGYGKVRKVRIVGMKGVSMHIEFAGKLPTAKSQKEQREQRSCEAMVCHVAHPGLIKFWVVHSESMEAYTLWWNGGNLNTFWKTNSKASEAATDRSIHRSDHLSAEDTLHILAYRKNRAKLAWALMCIVERVHRAKLIHNDIGPSNVMLHFPPDKVDEVYIGL